MSGTFVSPEGSMGLQHHPVRVVSCLVVSAFALGANIAAAQSTDSVSIDILASVPDRCGFASSTPTHQTREGNLEQAFRQDIRLKLDCNTPFAIHAVSQSGALVHTTASPDSSGFAFSKTYNVQVAVETDIGLVTSARCDSSAMRDGGACELANGRGLSSGHGVAVDRDAILTIDWPDQSGLPRRLAAGDYQDTITITIGARS
ncbi:hypothetical protein [Brevundimonas sp.]|uniref:hypothetical protein n=1 Tax=Brevundimonas sp. TaxID=1871086 RepID=UPI00289B6EF5|nr:hypothetical protein [Brevundimonas sp.]